MNKIQELPPRKKAPDLESVLLVLEDLRARVDSLEEYIREREIDERAAALGKVSRIEKRYGLKSREEREKRAEAFARSRAEL